MKVTTGLVHGDRQVRSDDGVSPPIVQTSTLAADTA